jgi:hypothetical protein
VTIRQRARFWDTSPVARSDKTQIALPFPRSAFGQNYRMKSDTRPRRYARLGLPKGMLVAWQADGPRTVSRVSTLGLGGIFISTKNPPEVGETLRLVFDVPSGEVRARAVVRDSQAGRGMGVEFTAMSLDGRARLDRLLRRLLK